MASNPFYIEPANAFSPLQALMQGYDRSQKLGREQELADARKAAGDALASGGGTRSALAKLIGAGDPTSATAIAQLGKADTTDDIREYNLARQQGFTGTFPEYQIALKRAGATRVNTSVNTGENAYAKTINEARAKDDIAIQQAGRSATTTLGTLGRMETLVNDPKFSSGPGAESIELPMKQLVARLGGNPNAASAMEEFRALSSKAALDGMGGSLGTGFSNADRDFITNQYPNLQNTPEGNRARIGGLKKIEQRKIEIAKRARDYARKNGGRLDGGFDEELAQWAEKNPLFGSAGGSNDGWTDMGNGIRIREKR